MGALRRGFARARRGAALAATVAALACGAGNDAPAGAPQAAAGDTRPPAPSGLLGPLLIVDQDAGAALPDGERTGALLIALEADADGSFAAPRLAASDPRWLDPTDALALPDGSWLVLESQWSPDGGPARGAIFRVTVERVAGEGGRLSVPALRVDPEPWWTDSRSRQPVALARDGQGTLFVSDRDADPLGLRVAEPGRRTGCVFGIEVGADGRPARTGVVAAGPELATPGALLASGPLLLLLDADANPRGLIAADGRAATPGVLFDLLQLDDEDRLAPRFLHVLLESEVTTSPVGLIERRPTLLRDGLTWRPLPQDALLDEVHVAPEVYLADANFDIAPDRLGDGALFRVEFFQKEFHDVPGLPARGLAARLRCVAETSVLGAHALVDPTWGCPLPDGRLAIADANADPRHLGADEGGKGVYGRGHGAVFAWDPDRPDALEVLAASELFVTPVAVRRLAPPDGADH